MKRTIKILCFLLILILPFSLFGCSAKSENRSESGVSIKAPGIASETMPGYISEEIENPDWLSRWEKCEIIGDSFCFVAYTAEDTLTAASYDTLSGEWSRYDDLRVDAVRNPRVENFSAAGNTFWVLLRESYTIEEQRNHDYARECSYYLVYMDISSGEQTTNRLDFWSEGDNYLISLIALDADRALVGDGVKTFILDPQGKVLEMPDLYIQGGGLHVQIGGELYVNSAEGLAPLNKETLRYGRPINAIHDQAAYCSSLGNFLTTAENKLYRVDPSSGVKTEIFDWMDVALSYRRLYGWSGLENANGDFFHYTDRITKVSRGEVPVKETLTLGCLGNASDELYEYYAQQPYTCTESLMDAIIRFNNSDPEYKIEIEPFIYHNSTERDKILIGLATNSSIDLIDTSLLPDGAVDEQLLVDLLPYIDADDSISREDFIPNLLQVMMKNNGLYEYTDKYTMLTMVTHKDLSSKEDWTAENIKSLMAQHPELAVPSNQNDLVKFFSWAATAEFMDQETLTCSFDSPVFISWLSLLKALSSVTPERSADAFLFDIKYDFAASAGFQSRWALKDEYTPIGFPGAKGTGSYFMKLGVPDPNGRFGRLSTGWSMITGCNTSLGIMAASENRDGAWRFIRTFMLGEDEPVLNKGIPVLAENFERAIEAHFHREQLNFSDYETFNEEDANYLRELVYQTTELVCSDAPVIDTLAAAINAYLGGNGSAEEAAQQIQSRMSIYMSEQYG